VCPNGGRGAHIQIWGTFLAKKTYKIKDYVVAAGVTVGATFFLLTGLSLALLYSTFLCVLYCHSIFLCVLAFFLSMCIGMHECEYVSRSDVTCASE